MSHTVRRAMQEILYTMHIPTFSRNQYPQFFFSSLRHGLQRMARSIPDRRTVPT